MNRTLSSLVGLSMLMLVVSCQKDNDFVENKVPVAEAGPAKSINMPTDSVVVTGSGNDADGKVVAYLWSQVAGPTNSTIVNPGAATTTIRFKAPGAYVFQLMVTDDKGATGVDTMSVVFNDATVKTLTLQPASNPNEINLILEGGTNLTGLADMDLPVEAWTRNGKSFTVRSLIKFDLSTISTTATIVSANLYLYSYPNPPLNGNLTDANFGTDNSMYVQQVAGNWSPGSVTWANQPAGVAANQISVATTNQSNLDLNLDVTNMVSSMVSANQNYGFLVKLQNEVTYNSRIFVSSRNPTYTTKYPKLVVVYK
jgi:hypothetical protein